MGFRAAKAATAALLAMTGCAALSGLDQLVDGQGGVGLRDDAGRPVDDAGRAGPVHPSADGSPGASPVDEPENDAGVVPVAPSFCATLLPKPTLCTDFDQGVLPAPWTAHATGSGATTLDTTISRSPPGSVFFSGGPSSRAYLASPTFAKTPTTELRLAFSIRPTLTVSGSDFELATINLGEVGGNPYNIQLELLDNDELNIEEETPLLDGGVPQREVPMGISLTPNVWRRIDIRISFAIDGSTLSVNVEGAAAPFTMPISAHLYKAPPQIMIGSDSSTTANNVHYDDIVVNIE